MGVNEIIARIRAEANGEVRRIQAEAAAETDRIRREGRERAEREAAAIVAAGREQAERQRRRVLARARLSARTALREVRENGIERSFEAADEHLAALARSPAYPDVLRALVAAGREAVGGGEVSVHCRPQDREAAEIACAGLPGITLVPTAHDGGGGVIVISGRMRSDQRFSARTERMRERLTREAAAILYREEGE
ncbi:V-type ATP synthase subunit E [Methanofollis fontis]|uniref:A-type ATP synthase subunit E n=1 Tax=Methanofollis fontis TaxID=2052832 RepID=A0A483CVP0_9EURY|nr:V-type ATP synthase subunit E family protein [Methanofollis fontis]TAJ45581.1 hypothetical protein CUJ86_02325 [Methanofollis fontis]